MEDGTGDQGGLRGYLAGLQGREGNGWERELRALLASGRPLAAPERRIVARRRIPRGMVGHGGPGEGGIGDEDVLLLADAGLLWGAAADAGTAAGMRLATRAATLAGTRAGTRYPQGRPGLAMADIWRAIAYFAVRGPEEARLGLGNPGLRWAPWLGDLDLAALLLPDRERQALLGERQARLAAGGGPWWDGVCRALAAGLPGWRLRRAGLRGAATCPRCDPALASREGWRSLAGGRITRASGRRCARWLASRPEPAWRAALALCATYGGLPALLEDFGRRGDPSLLLLDVPELPEEPPEAWAPLVRAALGMPAARGAAAPGRAAYLARWLVTHAPEYAVPPGRAGAGGGTKRPRPRHAREAPALRDAWTEALG